MNSMKNSIYDEYETQLSPFGRKVMISLLKFKEGKYFYIAKRDKHFNNHNSL